MNIKFAVIPLFPKNNNNPPIVIIEGPVLPNVGDEIDIDNISLNKEYDIQFIVEKILFYPTQRTLNVYKIENNITAIIFYVIK